MSFDDVLQPRRFNAENDDKPKVASATPSSNQAKSILADIDISEWGKQIGLSEELTQQVIVPLVAILDKHGGKIVKTDSPEIQAVSSLASTLNDFAPLLQGAYQYFTGVRKELNAADEALLEAHSAALSATELSNLFGAEDDFVFEDEQPQKRVEEKPKQNIFGPDGFEPPRASNDILSTGKVDYYELLGYGSEESFNQANGVSSTTTIYTDQQANAEQQAEVRAGTLPNKTAEISSIEVLGEENGLSAFELKRSDTNTKIKQGLSLDSVEITQQRVNDDINEIQKLMKQESLNRKMESKSAQEPLTMSAEEIIADMKEKANPGKGGQQTGEKHKSNKSMNAITDEALASLTANAFSIPGLAELQAAEAEQYKSQSKVGQADDGSANLTPMSFEEIRETTVVEDLSLGSVEEPSEDD